MPTETPAAMAEIHKPMGTKCKNSAMTTTARAMIKMGTAKKDTRLITQMLRKTQSAQVLADTVNPSVLQRPQQTSPPFSFHTNHTARVPLPVLGQLLPHRGRHSYFESFDYDNTVYT